MGGILIDTSSWTDSSLTSSGFYPNRVITPAEQLGYYVTKFGMAEIDTTFYTFPTRANVQMWLANTPAGFRFDVKAFRLFTQHPAPPRSIPRALRDTLGNLMEKEGNIYINRVPTEQAEPLWQAFAQAVQPLASAGKLGAIIFQFPPWFQPKEENCNYILTCHQKMRPHQIAVEFRTAAWMNDENKENTIGFLRQNEIALVCVDEPQGFKSSVPPIGEATASLGVVRFHGRNQDNWERKGVSSQEKFHYLYSESELREWMPRIEGMAENTDELHLIFKNKDYDSALKNALQMKQLFHLT